MQVVGLITEYNPFHNGHLHHLQESLRVTNADASVAVMSGHFLQRGEPALVDKWVRTEMALAAGVDVVLELPFFFACNSAPHFATGAVQSLTALGVVDSLCFGSESGDLHSLETISNTLADFEDEIEAGTSARLRHGINYPAARAEVLEQFLPDASKADLASPNNILGVEYLKAIRQTKSAIKPFTIQRRGAGYHDTDAVGSIASATGIRQKLAAGENVDALLPHGCRDLLLKALEAGRCLDKEKLFIALQSQLLQRPDCLQQVYLVNDGMDKRLFDIARTVSSFDELAERTKSRHWTLTRVQRTLMHVLLQICEQEMKTLLSAGPLYLRLLGNSEKGEKILADARKRKTLPIIPNPARANNVLNRYYSEEQGRCELAMKMLEIDLRATRFYTLLQKAPFNDNLDQDYYQPVRQAR